MCRGVAGKRCLHSRLGTTHDEDGSAMSYQVLARKWRPRTFQEMAGQGHVLKTLIHALDHQRLHHAYLFTGTRGVGKTTIARILARCLNCETGITSTPCGECGACREISEGRFLDLIEVDAASRTKVEDTRELLENVQYAPSRGRFKVYLIDEVHMLSTHSFNALLKTLEEPPPHVKFLLATTDPQKLPVTVLSRCLQFNLKNLSPERLVEHIRHILEVEGIACEEAALWQLGRAAQGSVRDCLTLLDQAIGYCEGQVTEAGVREFLGNIDRSIIAQLVDALVAQDAAALLAEVARVAEQSPDFAVILQELQSWLHRVAIAQVVPDGIDNSEGDRERILDHAQALPAETVQLYYQIALKSREDLPFALDARSGLEMALLRMLAFTPAGIPKPPAGKLAAVQHSAAAPTPADTAPTAPRDEAVPGKKPRTDTAHRARPVVSVSPAVAEVALPAPAVTDRVAPASSTVTDAAASASSVVEVATAPRRALADLQPNDWHTLFVDLRLGGVTRSIAANSVLQEVSGNELVLLLEQTQASLFDEGHRKRIEQALRDYFASPLSLRVEVGEVLAETPAQYRQRQTRERQAAALDSFTQDPVVQAMLERFDGEIRLDSIKPLPPAAPDKRGDIR